MTFTQRLTRAIEPWCLLKHPFYEAWMEGTLSRTQLKDYATRYFAHTRDFPRFVSSLHSLCDDPGARREILQNLLDEEGWADGHKPHPELWLDFAQGFGLLRDEVRTAPITPKTQALVDTYWRFCRSSYAEALGALYAYEYQSPEIAALKIQGLKENYGVSDASALAFFAVHESADRIHSEACGKLINKLHSERERALAMQAAKEASGALWDFLSEVHGVA